LAYDERDTVRSGSCPDSSSRRAVRLWQRSPRGAQEWLGVKHPAVEVRLESISKGKAVLAITPGKIE
jgi:hypothetical protein